MFRLAREEMAAGGYLAAPGLVYLSFMLDLDMAGWFTWSLNVTLDADLRTPWPERQVQHWLINNSYGGLSSYTQMGLAVRKHPATTLR